MVTVDFVVPDVDSVLGRSWAKALEGDARSLTDIVVRYYLFHSQVEFSIDGTTFLSRSSFVSLVDLALGMSAVAGRLAAKSDGALDFTEHDEVLRFVVSGEKVEVASSKKEAAVATVTRAELVGALTAFVGRVHDSVVTFHPALSENPTVSRLRQ